jgi:DNA-binding response OmpR family regulator
MVPLRVLIADDDQLVRMILERSVVKWGHKYISAKNGEAARHLLESHTVDVCILDWEMPELTGVEVCRWLKSSSPNKTAHVIMNTTKAHPEDMEQAYNAGANDYINKPTDLRHLRRKLAALADAVQNAAITPKTDAEPIFLSANSPLPE